MEVIHITADFRHGRSNPSTDLVKQTSPFARTNTAELRCMPMYKARAK